MSEPYEDHFMLCHNCGEQVERNKTGYCQQCQDAEGENQ